MYLKPRLPETATVARVSGWMIAAVFLLCLSFSRLESVHAVQTLTVPVQLGASTQTDYDRISYNSLVPVISGDPERHIEHALFWGQLIFIGSASIQEIDNIDGISTDVAESIFMMAQQNQVETLSWSRIDTIPGVGPATMDQLQRNFTLGKSK